MFFNLSLPPLVVLLLLAFLWLVLLVLLLWFAFRPRRSPDEAEEPETRPQSKPKRDGLEATLKTDPPRTRSPQPRTTVRAVSSTELDPDDEFDDFNRPGNRRDDLGF